MRAADDKYMAADARWAWAGLPTSVCPTTSDLPKQPILCVPCWQSGWTHLYKVPASHPIFSRSTVRGAIARDRRNQAKHDSFRTCSRMEGTARLCPKASPSKRHDMNSKQRPARLPNDVSCFRDLDCYFQEPERPWGEPLLVWPISSDEDKERHREFLRNRSRKDAKGKLSKAQNQSGHHPNLGSQPDASFGTRANT